jgi:polyhydroxybutyrate depolymerase
MFRVLLEVVLMAVLLLVVGVILYMVYEEPLTGHPAGKEGASASGEKASADVVDFLSHEGRQRRFLVHVPPQASQAKPKPVVLAFHTAFASAEQMREQSRLNEIADRNGFLAVYPEGVESTFNVGSGYGYAASSNVNDVGFVRELIGHLKAKYPADPERIYATGLGNGAMLCFRLACELFDRVAAIGPVGGDLPPGEFSAPKRPVPLIYFHGERDPIVPFGGGIGVSELQPVVHRAAADTVTWWVRANHCRRAPAAVKETKDYRMKRFAPPPGTAGAPVVVYALSEGGHTWPGGVDVTAGLGTGQLIASVDAGQLMWEFFAQFTLGGPGPRSRIVAAAR